MAGSDEERLDWLRHAVDKARVNAPELVVELVEREAPALPTGPALDEVLALTLDPLVMDGRVAEAQQRAHALLGSASPRARLEALAALRLCAEIGGRWQEALAAALAVVDSPDAQPTMKANLLASAAGYQMVLGRLDDAQRSADTALATATAAWSPGVVSAALRTRSWLALARGDYQAALDVAEQAVSAAGTTPKNRLPELALGLALAANDRLVEADRVLMAGQRSCEDRGWMTAAPYYAGAAAVVGYLMGRVQTAAVTDPPAPIAAGLALLVPAVTARRRLHLGDVPGALALVAAARAVPPSLWTAGWFEWVELLAAETTDADVAAPADTAAEALVTAELVGPWTVAAPDIVRLASPQARDDVVRFVEQGSRKARTASAAGCALHCAALVHGDWRRAVRGAERLAEAGRPLAQARALEDAAALAPEKKSGPLLHEAASLYSRCGAVADERRCAAQREGAPAPATGLHLLTKAERAVVALVADGLTNDDIASRLHVSPRTVQAHLSHVFDKLGVRSRAMVTARVVEQRSRQGDT